jgi:DNA-binding SARP family transcriptional activator
VEFRLLGRVEVEDAGRLLDLGRRRERCLLGILLIEAGSAIPLERLVDLLWDGEPPKTAREAVRTHVSRLRAGLDAGRDAADADAGDVTLERAGDGYLARVDPRRVDALRFRAMTEQARGTADPAARAELLRAALALWRGPLLADAASNWLRERIAGPWSELRVSAAEMAIEAELACGLDRELVGELTELIAENPFRERLTGLLMLALYRSGRQAEALEAFARLDGRLREELGLDPEAGLRDLHRRILAADPGLLAGGGAASAQYASAEQDRPTAPHQLPPATRVFTGRQAELERFWELAEASPQTPLPGTVVISAIDGMAGVGKTALALHVAHRLADRFPDGQLFVDLHGYTEDHAPRAAGEVLEMFLRALGVPTQRIPADPEERAGLYRGRLADTRTLIMLDNARSEAQVRPLLPGSASCLVLLTSRRRLRGLDDAYALSLDVLPSADSIALLHAVAGPGRLAADDPVLDEIARLCGNLPLALRIAGSLLRHRPSWTPGHLAGLLRDRAQRVAALSDGERDLPTVFNLSYQNIDDDHRRLFRRLGEVPQGYVDGYAVAALVDTDPRAAARLLDGLVDQNLLVEQTPGRYRLHDLLQLYAHTRAQRDPAEERDEALGRLLDFYRYTAQRAEDRVSRYRWQVPAGPAPAHAPEFPTPEAAWEWLRTERSCVEAALRHATEHGDDRRVISLTAGLATLLRTDGPWTDAVGLHKAAAAAALRLGDQKALAHALTCQGDMHRLTGEHEEAMRELGEAIELFQDLEDRLGQATALTLRGNVLASGGGQPDAAMRDLREALELYRELGDLQGQANAHSWLGDVRRLGGDHTGATRDLEQSLRLYRDLGDRRGQAHVLSVLGSARQVAGDLAGATRDLHEALELCRELGDKLAQSYAVGTLGAVRAETGDLVGALRDLEEGTRITEELGDQLALGASLTKLGETRGMAGDYAHALRDVERALGIFREIEARGAVGWALCYYGAVFAAMGEHLRAREVYAEALGICRQTQQADDEADALAGLGESHLSTGEREEGADYLRQALEIYRRLEMPGAARVEARLAELAVDH